MNSTINLAIIGFGYWGPNLLRNFSLTNDCKIKMVCDLRLDRLKTVKKNYPSVEVTTNVDDVYKDAGIDAVVIASPVTTHFSFTQRALKEGKHVLVEKPFALTRQHALDLIELAGKTKRTLMVDHTFLYTSAVQRIKKIITHGLIGKIKYVDSTRINLGLFQPDVNVLWDLAPHDISIFNYLIPEKPRSVQAFGVSHTHNGIENIAYLVLNFDSDLIAHFHCSWSSPVKIRQMLIGGDKKMVVYNDMEPTEKVKIYDSGYDLKTDEDRSRIMIDYRVGDIHVPKVEMGEALIGVCRDFVGSIREGRAPISDAASGLTVASILEAAQISIKAKGKEVLVPNP